MSKKPVSAMTDAELCDSFFKEGSMEMEERYPLKGQSKLNQVTELPSRDHLSITQIPIPAAPNSRSYTTQPEVKRSNYEVPKPANPTVRKAVEFWKARSPDAEILRRQCYENPWQNDTCVPLKEQNSRVVFYDVDPETKKQHVYYLQDKKAAYPDFIVSSTKLSGYHAKVCDLSDIMSGKSTKDVKKYIVDANKNPVPLDSPAVDVLGSAWNMLYSESAISVPLDEKKTYEPRALLTEGKAVPGMRTVLTNYLTDLPKRNWTSLPTFPARAKLFREYFAQNEKVAKCPIQCIQHCVFKHLETWMIFGDDTSKYTPFDAIVRDGELNKEQAEMMYILRILGTKTALGSLGFERFRCVNVSGDLLSNYLSEIFEALKVELRGNLIISDRDFSFHNDATVWGTNLHAYMEQRLKGEPTDVSTLREPEDLEQAEALLKYFKDNNIVFEPKNVELSIGSLLYKVCGSIDALQTITHSDGSIEYVIWDWKRTVAMMIQNKETGEIDPFRIEPGQRFSFSSDYSGYCIQMCIYRKLLLIEHPDWNISTVGHLGVMHPLQQTYQEILIDMERFMDDRSVATCKGVTDRISADGMFIETYTKPLNALQFVDATFEKRLEHLERHFGKIY